MSNFTPLHSFLRSNWQSVQKLLPGSFGTSSDCQNTKSPEIFSLRFYTSLNFQIPLPAIKLIPLQFFGDIQAIERDRSAHDRKQSTDQQIFRLHPAG